MTPRQIELARHALGLTRSKRTTRNYFVCGTGHSDYADWLAMAEAGLARRWQSRHFGGDDLFTLTRTAAEQVLQRGESIDFDYFPKEDAHG